MQRNHSQSTHTMSSFGKLLEELLYCVSQDLEHDLKSLCSITLVNHKLRG